jgi:hypothetical protein
MQDTPHRAWSSTLSKKRYVAVADLLAAHILDPAELDRLLMAFCNIMQFDPAARQYTPELGQRQHALRKARKLARASTASDGAC